MKLKIAMCLLPVEITSVGKEDFEKEHQVEPGYFCIEKFQKDKNQYEISLHTDITFYKEVDEAHKKLLTILTEISEVWPIITGSKLELFEKKTNETPNFSTNRDDIQNLLRKQENLFPVTKELSVEWSNWNRFKNPPLEDAISLRNGCSKDPELKKLISYYYFAIKHETGWFIPLYKVGEQLKKIHYLKEGALKEKLGICSTEWNKFNKRLNNHDLRHIGEGIYNNLLDSTDKNELYRIARSWIIKELQNRSIVF